MAALLIIGLGAAAWVTYKRRQAEAQERGGHGVTRTRELCKAFVCNGMLFRNVKPGDDMILDESEPTTIWSCIRVSQCATHHDILKTWSPVKRGWLYLYPEGILGPDMTHALRGEVVSLASRFAFFYGPGIEFENRIFQTEHFVLLRPGEYPDVRMMQ